MSPTWTNWSCAAVSKSAGTCQSTMTPLNATSAVQGFITNRPTGRRSAETRLNNMKRSKRRRMRTGSPWRRGSHGAPATTRIGAKKASRMCPTMCT